MHHHRPLWHRDKESCPIPAFVLCHDNGYRDEDRPLATSEPAPLLTP